MSSTSIAENKARLMEEVNRHFIVPIDEETLMLQKYSPTYYHCPLRCYCMHTRYNMDGGTYQYKEPGLVYSKQAMWEHLICCDRLQECKHAYCAGCREVFTEEQFKQDHHLVPCTMLGCKQQVNLCCMEKHVKDYDLHYDNLKLVFQELKAENTNLKSELKEQMENNKKKDRG